MLHVPGMSALRDEPLTSMAKNHRVTDRGRQQFAGANAEGRRMIPDKIIQGMYKHGPKAKRPSEQSEVVRESLAELDLLQHDQVREIFEVYNFAAILSRQLGELLDVCSPTRQIFEATEFGRDIYNLPDGYICLSSGEGEGFILYSKINQKVYDLEVAEFDDLEQGKAEPTWESFFELIEWYVA
tara:strand:+ start:30 stop:581 length:552 start_codon:yes stop_codon:yes gene_type:complete